MSYICTLIYAIFILFRPQDWLFPWMLKYEVVNIIAIISLLALMIDILTGSVKIPKKLPHFWLILGVFFAIVMSHVAHTYWFGIQGSFQNYGKKLVFFMLILLTTNSVKRLRGMMLLPVISAVVITIHCHLQITRGYGFAGLKPLWQLRFSDGIWSHQPRALFFGTFGDPNDTCLLLLAAIPCAFALFPKKLLPISAALAASFVYAISLTKSRGGQLGLIVLVALLFHRFFSKKWFIIAGTCGILLFTQAVPMAAKFGFVDQSALDRAIFWGEANQYFKSSPTNLLFGVGYGMLSTDYMEKDRAVHNSFVTCYAEIGIFGYFFWFTLVALLLAGSRYISRLEPESKSDKTLKRFASLMVPALGGYYTSSYFLTRPYHLSFLFLMGLCAVLYRLTAEKIGYKTMNDHLWVTGTKIWFYPVLSLGSILFIYLSIRVINALG